MVYLFYKLLVAYTRIMFYTKEKIYDLGEIGMERKNIEAIWEKIDKKLSRTAVSSFDFIPYTTVDGKHTHRNEEYICAWTNGFWSALMMLMYIGTKNEQYLKTARNGMDILDEAFTMTQKLHHDVGFMWNISSGVDYRVTGDLKEKNRFVLAANCLMSRYNIAGKFLQAWNDPGTEGWVIIDCMMNIPLLYRASQELGDERFAMIANAHADTAMCYHVREDGSCNHINEYSPITGEFIKSHAGQGYADDSSWSRGQSWGIYGFALAYRYTKNAAYLNTAKKIAHYFIANVQKTDWVALCDFRQPAGEELYDTTASACAACGLLEIAQYVPENEKDLYISAAKKMLEALESKHCNWEESEDSILQNGTEAYIRGHHMPIIYGDYFFVEGIYRLMGFDSSVLW